MWLGIVEADIFHTFSTTRSDRVWFETPRRLHRLPADQEGETAVIKAPGSRMLRTIKVAELALSLLPKTKLQEHQNVGTHRICRRLPLAIGACRPIIGFNGSRFQFLSI